MNEKPIRSRGSLIDHGAHEERNALCYGGGPFIDQTLYARRTPDPPPADPCLCTDSIRSVIGSCPEKGHREYESCPKRRYSDEYIRSRAERYRSEEDDLEDFLDGLSRLSRRYEISVGGSPRLMKDEKVLAQELTWDDRAGKYRTEER